MIKAIKLIMAKSLELILWLVKPKLVETDREFGEYLTTYGGGKLYGKSN